MNEDIINEDLLWTRLSDKSATLSFWYVKVYFVAFIFTSMLCFLFLPEKEVVSFAFVHICCLGGFFKEAYIIFDLRKTISPVYYSTLITKLLLMFIFQVLILIFIYSLYFEYHESIM